MSFVPVRFLRFFPLLLLIALPAAPSRATAPTAGPVTNLPVPRFVSLKRSEVNMRRGPGSDHPIIWVYKRRDMPVEITNEFEQWRKVRDMDGAEGWIQANMLSGDPRYVVVRGKSGKAAGTVGNDPANGWVLRRKPEARGRAVAIVEPGVVAELRHCPDDWCEVKAGHATGWIERVALWGVYPDEKLK